MASDFLFGIPNSVQGWKSRKLWILGSILICCGISSIVNATVATITEAVKTYQLQHYTNTHWITTVFLFAGVSTILLDVCKINWFLYLSVTFTIVSIPIGIGAIIANSINLWMIKSANSKATYDWRMLDEGQANAMYVYAAFDLAYSLVAAIVSVILLREISYFSSRYFASVEEYKTKSLLACGVVMSVVGGVRVAFLIEEIAWLKGLGKSAQYLFLHYTMDEPIWNMIYCITGALLMTVSIRGTRVLMTISLALVTLTTYPAVLYLWIDYRWYSNVKLTEVTVQVPKPPNLLEWNLGLGAVHLVMILISATLIIRLLYKTGTGEFFHLQLNTESTLRRAVSLAGLLYILAGFAFLVSDVTNLLNKSFYRVFYPTEQRAPFLLFVTGVMTILCLRRNLSVYFLPVAFCLQLMTFHSTFFHIAAYVFLTYQTYFSKEMCELFYFGVRDCSAKIERLGSLSHFFEAAMAAGLLALTLYTAVVLGRVMRLHRISMGQLGIQEQKRKAKIELMLIVLGILRVLIGLITVILSLYEFGAVSSNEGLSRHPLIILHSFVYRLCLSFALLIYPTIQLIFSKDILYTPLRSITLVVISAYRFVDVISQVDYRNFSQSFSMGWTMYSAVELASLLAHFTIIAAVGVLLDMNLHRMPTFDYHTGPLRTMSTEDAGGHGRLSFSTIAANDQDDPDEIEGGSNNGNNRPDIIRSATGNGTASASANSLNPPQVQPWTDVIDDNDQLGLVQ